MSIPHQCICLCEDIGVCVYGIAMAVVLNQTSLLEKVTLCFKPPTLDEVHLHPHVNWCSVNQLLEFPLTGRGQQLRNHD